MATTSIDTALTWGHAQLAEATARGWGSLYWQALGTSVQLVVTDPEHLADARDAVQRVLEDIDLAASRFRDDSELSRLNSAAGRTLTASPLLGQALRVALDAAAWTDGLVDPTVGASMLATGYDRTYRLLDREGPPISVALAPAPGWQRVELDDETRRVRVPEGVVLDLGATAKALASDLASEAAATVAGCGVLLSLGGDVSVSGAMPDDGWPVRISDRADPELPVEDDDQDDAEIVLLFGGGLATSGTQARRWRRGGSWMHHIMDPRHGGPAGGPWVTASVTATTSVLANAASTAAVILGDDAPGWLAARGLPYRLVDADRRVVRGAGWPVPPQGISTGALS